METERRQTDGGEACGSRDGDVVRFPKDWLGPREELVPFGALEDPVVEIAPAPPRPQDFWDEGAAAVHDAFQAPEVGFARARVLSLRARVGNSRAKVGTALAATRVSRARTAISAALVLVALAGTVVAGFRLGGARRSGAASTHSAASAAADRALGTAQSGPLYRRPGGVAHARAARRGRRAQSSRTVANRAGGQTPAPRYAAPTYAGVAAQSYGPPANPVPASSGGAGASSGSVQSSGTSSGYSGAPPSSRTGSGSGEGAAPSAGPQGPGAPFGPGHLG